MLLMCTDVMAAWTKLEDAHVDGITVYADVGKIRNKGKEKVKMQHIINFQNKETAASGHQYQSRKELVEYDCVEEHYRVLASSLYKDRMGHGKIVSFNSDARQWEPVEFNTLEETLWKIACDAPKISQHD